jgi:hypothetical protein
MDKFQKTQHSLASDSLYSMFGRLGAIKIFRWVNLTEAERMGTAHDHRQLRQNGTTILSACECCLQNSRSCFTIKPSRHWIFIQNQINPVNTQRTYSFNILTLYMQSIPFKESRVLGCDAAWLLLGPKFRRNLSPQ